VILVEGALSLEVDGSTARLTAEGARVRVDAADPDRLLASGSPAALRAAASLLAALGVTVDVTSRGRTLIVLGGGVRPSVLARLLRLDHVAIPLRAAPAFARARRSRP
jgi:hypothetical protein